MGDKMRTLLITQKNGDETQIDVPETWKITFGPAVVGMPKSEGRVPMALRIYETEKLQRAIFTDVTSFRDMSIPIRVKKVNVQEKDGFMECEGVRKRTTFQASTTEWINPDEEVEDKPLLTMPTDAEMFDGKKNSIEVEVTE